MRNFRVNFNLIGPILRVDDYTDYCHNDYVVEFVTYVKDGVSTLSTKSKSITKACGEINYRYELESDGRYVYYKVILPFYDMFDGCGYKVDIPYGYFVAEDINNNKIVCFNSEKFVSLQNSSEAAQVEVVEDYYDMIKSGLLSPDEYFSKEFFSINKLNTCVANIQKKYVLEHIDDCGSKKCNKGSDTEKANRDFIFVSSYILDFLISNGDFDQAEELLDKLSSCGTSICDELNNSKSCGCNG